MQPKISYKIVFDTNTLRSYSEESQLGRLNLKGLTDFLKQHKQLHKVYLAVPELVLKEIVQQDLEAVEGHIAQVKNASNALKGLGVRISNKTYQRDYIKKINSIHTKTLEEYNIEVLKTPVLNQQELIERAIKGRKPFASRQKDKTKKGTDKGFKDTVIWCTLLKDAEKSSAMNYIFCTSNNTDFPEDILQAEFKSVSPDDSFRVLDSISSIKEFLDSEFSLRLDLRERNSQIEDEIKTKIGEITLQVNQLVKTKYQWPFSIVSSRVNLNGYSSLRTPGGVFSKLDQDDIFIYDFSDLEIRDITPSDGEYIISVNLYTKKINLNPDEVMATVPKIYSPSFNIEDRAAFSVQIRYNRTSNKIEVISADRIY